MNALDRLVLRSIFFIISACFIPRPGLAFLMIDTHVPLVSITRTNSSTERAYLETVQGYPKTGVPPRLLTYSAVLHNQTDHLLVAYMVRWRCSHGTQAPVYFNRLTWAPLTTDTTTPVAPHSDRFVSLTFNFALARMNDDASIETELGKRLDALDACSSVDILLDAAITEDGSVFGPDAVATRAHLYAWSKSHYDVWSYVVALSSKPHTSYEPMSSIDDFSPARQASLYAEPDKSFYNDSFNEVADQIIQQLQHKSLAEIAMAAAGGIASLRLRPPFPTHP